MRQLKVVAAVVVGAWVGAGSGHIVDAQGPVRATVWAPRPVKRPGYTAPHRPHVRLADLRAKHQQDREWRELLIDDGHSRGEYIQSAPGSRVSRRFHPDTRQWWAVLDGQIRVEIEGHEPFVATRGSVVQVPKQRIYAMETIGDRPSLRFEVSAANVKTLYPEDVSPDPMPGVNYVQAAYTRRPADYDEINTPHTNLFDIYETAQSDRGTSRVVRDPRFEGLLIHGYEKALGPLEPGDRGHFHPESAEFWVVMSGRIQYLIEDVPLFTADEGDVVYVPPTLYHRARFEGTERSCRLSITEFQNNSQLVEIEP